MPDFGGLAADLATAWSAPGVTTRARQQLIRALVADVIADVDEATREVVSSVVASLPRPALERIYELSGGNPMYAIELARAVDVFDDLHVAALAPRG